MKSTRECDSSEDDNRSEVPWWCSARLALAMIGFFGFVNMYAQRINLSVAIVCMMNNTALRLDQNSTKHNNETITNMSEIGCLASSSSSARRDGEFAWDKETRGIILGAFFWGYMVTQVPGGWLAERFGGKHVFGWFMFMASVSTLLMPIGSRTSPYFLMALRFITGLGEGVVFPACHAMWSRWAPPLERSKLIGFTYAGAQIGNVITLPLSAVLCDNGFDGGWASIFYVFGILGIIWFVAWMLLTSDNPGEHRRITPAERKYIESCVGDLQERDLRRKKMGTPWLQFTKSLPVWAIVVAHTCGNWGTYTLLTNIPAYMKEVLYFDIKSNGLFSAIPYIFFWAFINIGGVIADSLRTRGWRTVVVRKIMCCLGTIFPGLFLIGTGYVTCSSPYIAVATLSLAVGFSGFQYPGIMVNHVDIAPPFAGILFGISNTFATLSGIFAPYVIGRITQNGTQEEWRLVFYIAAVIYAVGALFFTLFAQGETQDWVKPYMAEGGQPAVLEVVENPGELQLQAFTKIPDSMQEVANGIHFKSISLDEVKTNKL